MRVRRERRCGGRSTGRRSSLCSCGTPTATPYVSRHRPVVAWLAPDDELRDTLVPVNTRWKVAEALAAAHAYAEATGRRVSIEYALIREVNDQPWRADLLGEKLHAALGSLVHVNLIPLNPT